MLTVTSEIRANLDGALTYPVRLFKLGGNPDLYFTDADKVVRWNDIDWQPKGISYAKVKRQLGMEVDTASIKIDNLDDSMISWALAHDPTGFYSTIYKGVSAGNVDGSGRLLLIGDQNVILFYGRNTHTVADTEFELNCKSFLDLYRQNSPRSSQDVTCRFRGIDGFKGPNCGYAGPETECNFTEARCRALDNFARFGGFPSLSTKTDS